jgi:hypothetical protein
MSGAGDNFGWRKPGAYSDNSRQLPNRKAQKVSWHGDCENALKAK